MTDTFVYDARLDPRSDTSPLDRLLAKCKELDAKAMKGPWPIEHLAMRDAAIDYLPVSDDEQAFISAARTLLPGLAKMVRQLYIMCANRAQDEDAGYDRSMRFAEFCVSAANEDAAGLLAKLEAKEKDDD